MLETPQELADLQTLLDTSAAAAGPHLREIITDDRRLTAIQLSQRLHGMRLLTLATVTADGRPLTSPVDGYFLHGTFHFSSSTNAVRIRHLTKRPAISATHLPDEHLAVTLHGHAELFDLHSPQCAELRQAMLDHYLPIQGPAFQDWLENLQGGLGARIVPAKMFTFAA